MVNKSFPNNSSFISNALSQVKISIPLLEMMRIEEHKEKALSWVSGVAPTDTQMPLRLIN